MKRYKGLTEDRQKKYEIEFSRNQGIKALFSMGSKHEISSVLQCLFPISALVQKFLVQEQKNPLGKNLQRLFITVF